MNCVFSIAGILAIVGVCFYERVKLGLLLGKE